MLQFATPGSPLSTSGSGGTLAGLKRTHELGITAMEIEWVQSVPKNAEHVEKVGALAAKLGITLTVHAPYFVNLNSDDPEKIEASITRILNCLSMAQVAGAVSVCVHPAFYGKRPPEEALENVRTATNKVMKMKAKYFPDVNLAYETMGKHSQFGTLEEVLTVSKEFDIYPCIDIAHMHARSNGNVNSEPVWSDVFDTYQKYLGKRSLSHMHIHYSGINYGNKGEKNHLTFEESDLDWKGFMKFLKKRDVGGVLVCESPAQENDTLLLQNTYKNA